MIHKLDKRFTGIGEVKGFEFTQVFSNSKGYVYKVKNGKKEYFETFYKRKSPLCLDFDNRIYSETDFKETYPKAKSFGKWAWTYDNLSNAKNRIV